MTKAGDSTRLFLGGGELGKRVRDYDWSNTPIGPIAEWPQSLHSVLNLMLTSPQPAFLWWGPELTQFYNDAARFIVAEHALGQPAKSSWREMWHAPGPAVEAAMAGNAAQVKDVLLLPNRDGYSEERYFNYALSPVLNDQGEVGGVFCSCTEETARVLDDRRLRTLHQLSVSRTDAISVAFVSDTIKDALSTNPHDIPFALLYLLPGENDSLESNATAQLAASVGIEPGTAASPTQIDLADDQIWPLSRVRQSMQAEVLDNLADTLGNFIANAWHQTPSAASIAPLILPGQQQLMGFLVLGISPKRSFDDDYQGFFDLISSQVAHAVADAIDYEAKQTLHEVRKAATDSERSFELSLQQAAEAAAAETQQQVSMVLESISDAFVAFNREWRYTYVNDKATQLLQRSREELIGKHVWEKVFPERVGLPVYTELQRVMSEQQPAVFEIFDPTVEVWAEAHAYPSDEGVSVYFHDISDRKQNEFKRHQAEALLRDAHLQLEAALAAGEVYTWRWDLKTDRIVVNAPFAHLFSVDADIATTAGLPLKHFTNAIYEADQAYVAEQIEQAISTTGDYAAEYRVQTASGEEKWLTARGQVVYDAAGKPTSLPGALVDITERKRMEVSLREKEQAFSAIFDQAFQLMGQLTPQGIVLSVNQIALQVVNTSHEAVCGQYLWDTPWWNHNAALQAKLKRSVAKASQGEFIRYEADFPGADGATFTIDFSLKPVMNDAGEVMLLIAEGRDITQRKQAEAERDKLLQAARSAREVAETANRIKDEFLAVVSHELRTPLNPILGWSQMLRKRQLNAEKTEYALATIERNAKIQAQLINDLLDVSRILRGKLSLEAAPVNLATVIRMAKETVGLAAEAKSIEIETDLDPAVGPVSGDASRLQQVVWNLLSNAIKFTPDGGRVTVCLGQSENRAKITVSDTGKGIDPSFLPHVFERFHQEDAATTRKFGGLGLGLAIVSSLVELHGGTIEVQSPGENQGATFTVSLPFTSNPAEIEPVVELPAVPESLEGVYVLVVEDDENAREVVTYLLEMHGATVITTDSAAAAIAALTQAASTSHKVDIILSDIGMPKVDGYMLMRQVRSLPPEQGGNTPAIALTAYASEVDHRQSALAGFQKHIAKPIEFEKLIKVISQLLKLN